MGIACMADRLPRWTRTWRQRIPPRQRQKPQTPAYGLDSRSRRIVIRALLRVCEQRKWKLWAARARPTRVSMVVQADATAAQVLSTLKAAATRAFQMYERPLAARGESRG